MYYKITNINSHNWKHNLLINEMLRSWALKWKLN